MEEHLLLFRILSDNRQQRLYIQLGEDHGYACSSWKGEIMYFIMDILGALWLFIIVLIPLIILAGRLFKKIKETAENRTFGSSTRRDDHRKKE